jgi:hypothetical protein
MGSPYLGFTSDNTASDAILILLIAKIALPLF